jgi:hypothetical protein
MRTNPDSRRRYVSEQAVTPGIGLTIAGLGRIIQGVFGTGSPGPGLASQNVTLDAAKTGGPFTLHEGDVFLPGTGNWALDPSYDGPLQTVWGHGFLRTPNTFRVRPGAPQVQTYAASALFGVGGQIAGQFINQPLSDNQEIGGE